MIHTDNDFLKVGSSADLVPLIASIMSLVLGTMAYPAWMK